MTGAYLSCSSGCNVAGAAAVFSVFVAIAIELLSAVLAGQTIKCFFVDFVLVAVPISHPTLVRAEFLFLAVIRLNHRFPTLPAYLIRGQYGMPVDVGTDGAGRQSKGSGDLGRGMPLQPHIVDGDFVLQSHDAHSFRNDRNSNGRMTPMSHPPRLKMISRRAYGADAPLHHPGGSGHPGQRCNFL